MSSTPMNILFGKGKDDMFNNNIYILELYLKDGTYVKFEDTNNEKYINIFTFRNNINYYNIQAYELTVINKKTIYIQNEFNSSLSSYIYKDTNIFLEISKNIDNIANCCIYLTSNNSQMFFTPPNY
jgi:hypothetical protein